MQQSHFHAKIATASDAAAAAKQATSNKNDSRKATEIKVRSLARRIKAHPLYSAGQGDHLGVEGPVVSSDLSLAKPVLTGADQTGGTVALSFNKLKSDGINVYSQREGDSDWVLLGRATVSPFLDNRRFWTIARFRSPASRSCAVIRRFICKKTAKLAPLAMT